MISIIVCYRFNDCFASLTKNIGDTVGLPYEIIGIDNTKNEHSICSAYNKGASGARFRYLCFVHEDVQFETKDWGIKLIAHFKDEQTGLVGIAGNTYKSKIPTTWPQSTLSGVETKRIHLIQHYKRIRKQEEHVVVNPMSEQRSEVVNLDGVFLATTKYLWEQHKFDENLLKGFHGYDLDFSLKIGESHKLYVVYDVLLHHFSEGECEINCILDYISLHKKWRNKLPVVVQPYSIDRGFIYKFSWEKLNKHIRSFIKSNKSLLFSFNQYCRLITLIDKRPSPILFYKDVVVQWIVIIRFYFWYKRNFAK